MHVFGKKSKDQSQEGTASVESPSGDLPNATTPEDEQAVLDQYFDLEADESPTADLSEDLATANLATDPPVDAA